jgi:chromosomal replication initiation ATPase DnaA
MIAQTPEIVERIVQQVADKYQVSPAVLLLGGRMKPLVWWRFEVYYRSLAETVSPHHTIAKVLKMDRTTILHGAWRYAEMNNLPAPRNYVFRLQSRMEKNRKRAYTYSVNQRIA